MSLSQLRKQQEDDEEIISPSLSQGSISDNSAAGAGAAAAAASGENTNESWGSIVNDSYSTQPMPLWDNSFVDFIEEFSNRSVFRLDLEYLQTARTKVGIDCTSAIESEVNQLNNKDCSCGGERDPEYITETEGLFDEFKCPICLDILINTVKVDCSYGHAFCNFCIQYWMENGDQLIIGCPICRCAIFIKYWTPKIDLRINKIFETLSEKAQQIRQAAVKERMELETETEAEQQQTSTYRNIFLGLVELNNTDSEAINPLELANSFTQSNYSNSINVDSNQALWGDNPEASTDTDNNGNSRTVIMQPISIMDQEMKRGNFVDQSGMPQTPIRSSPPVQASSLPSTLLTSSTVTSTSWTETEPTMQPPPILRQSGDRSENFPFGSNSTPHIRQVTVGQNQVDFQSFLFGGGDEDQNLTNQWGQNMYLLPGETIWSWTGDTEEVNWPEEFNPRNKSK